MARKITLKIEENAVTIVEYLGSWGGEDFELIMEETFDIMRLNEEMRQHAMLHGLAQKLCDSTASMSDKKGYAPEERFATMRNLFDQLENGEWKKKGEGTGPKISLSSVEKKAKELGLEEEALVILKQLGLFRG